MSYAELWYASITLLLCLASCLANRVVYTHAVCVVMDSDSDTDGAITELTQLVEARCDHRHC